jgi:negative regulator of replication initiation
MNPDQIKNSGASTHPQQLDETPFWVLGNLSNDRKRAIVEVVLRHYKYNDATISAVLRTIPDSGIRRTGRIIV